MRKQSMKAILFDVDDTLYDQVQPFARAYARVFGDSYPLREGKIEEIFAVSRKYSDEVFKASTEGTITMEQMYIYRIQKALADFEVLITDEQALTFQKYYQDF